MLSSHYNSTACYTLWRLVCVIIGERASANVIVEQIKANFSIKLVLFHSIFNACLEVLWTQLFVHDYFHSYFSVPYTEKHFKISVILTPAVLSHYQRVWDCLITIINARNMKVEIKLRLPFTLFKTPTKTHVFKEYSMSSKCWFLTSLTLSMNKDVQTPPTSRLMPTIEFEAQGFIFSLQKKVLAK